MNIEIKRQSLFKKKVNKEYTKKNYGFSKEFIEEEFFQKPTIKEEPKIHLDI